MGCLWPESDRLLGADARRRAAVGGHLPAARRAAGSGGADPHAVQQQQRRPHRTGAAARGQRLRVRDSGLPRALGLGRRLLPVPRGGGRLRHPGVGGAAAVVQRQAGYRRRLLPGHGAMDRGAAAQQPPGMHGAARDEPRFPRRRGLSGRRLGVAAVAHRVAHRLPRLGRRRQHAARRRAAGVRRAGGRSGRPVHVRPALSGADGRRQQLLLARDRPPGGRTTSAAWRCATTCCATRPNRWPRIWR